MKKLISFILSVVLLIGVLAGCGNSSSSSNEDQTASTDTTDTAADTPAAVTHILAATYGAPKPWVYTDDDDNLIGYEPEVLNAVDELLEDYEFEFVLTDFSAIFTGIDAGLYGIGFNSITKNAEREEKYLFGDEYVAYSYVGAVVRADDDSIQTLEDLGGKRAYVTATGGFSQLFLEGFNEEHPDNPVELTYSSVDTLKIYQEIAAGTTDFTLNGPVMFATYIEEYPELADSLKLVRFSDEETEQIQDPYSWFVYPKTEEGEALKEAVDGALRQLKEDGTLNEIAQKYLHYDVVW